jgi:hypothetical protein
MNPIEILITADASGLKTALNSAITMVGGTINAINSQQVDWASIFTGALSAGLITSISLVLADSIAQALSMQNILSNLGSTSGGTSTVTTGLTNVNNVVQQTGASATDAATAYDQFFQIFQNGATATTATTDAIDLAQASGQSLSTTVSALIPLFENWGVTTIPQVNTAVTALANTIGNGQFSVIDLANAIGSMNTSVQKYTSIGNLAIQMQELSSNTSLGKSTITDLAQTIATQSSQIAPFNGQLQNLNTTLQSQGLIGAVQELATKLQSFGSTPSVAGQVFGVNVNDVSKLTTNTSSLNTGLATAATNSSGVSANMKPLDSIVQNNTSDTLALSKSWSKFTDTLSQFVIPAGILALSTLINGMNSALQKLQEFIQELSGSKSLSGIVNSLGGKFSNVTTPSTLPGEVPSTTTSALQQSILQLFGGSPSIIPSGSMSGTNSQNSGALSPNSTNDLVTALNNLNATIINSTGTSISGKKGSSSGKAPLTIKSLQKQASVTGGTGGS